MRRMWKEFVVTFPRISSALLRSAFLALGILSGPVSPALAAERCEGSSPSPCGPVYARSSVTAAIPIAASTTSIRLEPSMIRLGEIARLSWRAAHGTKVLLNGEVVTPFGEIPISPTNTTEYLIEVEGPGGRSFASTILLVLIPPKAPSIGFITEPDRVKPGEVVELIWATENAEHAWLDGETVSLAGSRRVTIEATRSWELRAEGAGGSRSHRATAIVHAPPPPAPPPPASPLPDRILFDFDEWVIRDDGRDTIERIAVWMRTDPDLIVRLEGHTDGRGTPDYNMALGRKRAEATRDFLAASFGVSPTRFEIMSRGEDLPIAPERQQNGRDNPEGRQLNRRVLFLSVR